MSAFASVVNGGPSRGSPQPTEKFYQSPIKGHSYHTHSLFINIYSLAWAIREIFHHNISIDDILNPWVNGGDFYGKISKEDNISKPFLFEKEAMQLLNELVLNANITTSNIKGLQSESIRISEKIHKLKDSLDECRRIQRSPDHLLSIVGDPVGRIRGYVQRLIQQLPDHDHLNKNHGSLPQIILHDISAHRNLIYKHSGISADFKQKVIDAANAVEKLLKKEYVDLQKILYSLLNQYYTLSRDIYTVYRASGTGNRISAYSYLMKNLLETRYDALYHEVFGVQDAISRCIDSKDQGWEVKFVRSANSMISELHAVILQPDCTAFTIILTPFVELLWFCIQVQNTVSRRAELLLMSIRNLMEYRRSVLKGKSDNGPKKLVNWWFQVAIVNRKPEKMQQLCPLKFEEVINQPSNVMSQKGIKAPSGTSCNTRSENTPKTRAEPAPDNTEEGSPEKTKRSRWRRRLNKKNSKSQTPPVTPNESQTATSSGTISPEVQPQDVPEDASRAMVTSSENANTNFQAKNVESTSEPVSSSSEVDSFPQPTPPSPPVSTTPESEPSETALEEIVSSEPISPETSTNLPFPDTESEKKAMEEMRLENLKLAMKLQKAKEDLEVTKKLSLVKDILKTSRDTEEGKAQETSQPVSTPSEVESSSQATPPSIPVSTTPESRLFESTLEEIISCEPISPETPMHPQFPDIESAEKAVKEMRALSLKAAEEYNAAEHEFDVASLFFLTAKPCPDEKIPQELEVAKAQKAKAIERLKKAVEAKKKSIAAAEKAELGLKALQEEEEEEEKEKEKEKEKEVTPQEPPKVEEAKRSIFAMKSPKDWPEFIPASSKVTSTARNSLIPNDN